MDEEEPTAEEAARIELLDKRVFCIESHVFTQRFQRAHCHQLLCVSITG
jgi:hypothetical protein